MFPASGINVTTVFFPAVLVSLPNSEGPATTAWSNGSKTLTKYGDASPRGILCLVYCGPDS